MKTCPITDQDLFLLARGELSPLQGLSVRTHVVVCPACRARVAKFQKVSSMLQEGYTGFPKLPPLWKQMPVFPIGLILIAGIASTAFVISHGRWQGPSTGLHVSAHVNNQGENCGGDASSRPTIPKRDPRSFVTWQSAHPGLTAPNPKAAVPVRRLHVATSSSRS